ncbi:hypothetical protein ACFX13_033877 [Malus domestica]
MSVSSLARMAQASDESPMDYLTRFKSAKNWCQVPLPEVEFVKLALNKLDVEYKKKFLGANFQDMYELTQHVEQYDYLLREEKISKSLSRGTIYKTLTINYASAEGEDSQYVSVDATETVIDKPYVCKALTQINSRDAKTRSTTEEMAKPSKVYTFDITKAEVIFDQLLLAKIIKLRLGHNIPKAEEHKGKTYCKYHNSTKNTTNNCVIFRDDIQSWIDKGKLKFPKKRMVVDVDPFPSTTIGMVDAHLPKSKGKWKAEFVPVQHVLKKNSRPRLKIDLFSNEPPIKFSGPVVGKSMSDSSAKGIDESMVLCSNCRACVVLTEPKQRPTPRQLSKSVTTPPKELSEGQCQKVFDKFGPQEQIDVPTLARRHFDFDAPFYDEDY